MGSVRIRAKKESAYNSDCLSHKENYEVSRAVQAAKGVV